MASTIGTVRPYTKTNRPTLGSEDRLISDHPDNGVGATRYEDFQAQQDARYLLKTQRNAALGVAGLAADGLLDPSVMRAALAPEEVATDAALAALAVVTNDIGKRLVRVTATGISYIARAAGTGADKWQVYNTTPAATEAVAGVSKIASDADADSETDDTKQMTAKKVARRIAARVNPIAASRAPLDYLWCDVSTLAARIFWIPGVHGQLGASDFTVVIPCVQMAVLNTSGMLFCTRDTPDVGYNDNSLRVYVYNDTIRVCLGSDTASRTRSTPAGSANSLLERPYTIIFGRQAGDWFFYKDNTAIPLGAEVVVGVPAIGWADAFSTAVMRLGAHIATHPTRMSRFGSPILINRAWAQSDVSAYISTGRVPPQDDVAGSMVPMFSEGFESASWGLWGSNQGTRLLVTDIVHSGDQAAQYTPTQPSNYAFSGLSRNSTFTPGQAYRIGGWFYRPSGSAWTTSGRTLSTDTASFTGALRGTLVDDQWCYLERDIVAVSTNLILYGLTNGISDIIYVDDVTIIPLGTIVAFDIGETSQLRGKYNGIHALITPGITPMPVRSPETATIIYNLSATGYILGDLPAVFRDYLVSEVQLMPLSATDATVTLRQGSSGGTVIVSSASAGGVQNQWSGPVAIEAAGRLLPALSKLHGTTTQPVRVLIHLKKP